MILTPGLVLTVADIMPKVGFGDIAPIHMSTWCKVCVSCYMLGGVIFVAM